MQVSMGSVFVSYSHEDESVVASLVSALADTGIHTWHAGGRLPAGAKMLEIFEKIAGAQYFILVLSKSSTLSEWVHKEMGCALALQISRGTPVLVPVRIDATDLSAAMLAPVADVRWIDLRSHNFTRGFEELIVRLSGLEDLPKSESARFRSFVESLIVLNDEVCSRVGTVDTLNMHNAAPNRSRGKSPEIESVERTRWRQDLESELASANLSPIEILRILADFDAHVTLPVVTAEDKKELREWASRFGDDILDLAVEFWNAQLSGRRGTTVRAICDYVEERRKASDPEWLWWKGEDLGRRAMEAGLLVRSTEDPVGYAALDAGGNPSYDFSWAVRVAGQWTFAFREREKLARSGLQNPDQPSSS